MSRNRCGWTGSDIRVSCGEINLGVDFSRRHYGGLPRLTPAAAANTATTTATTTTTTANTPTAIANTAAYVATRDILTTTINWLFIWFGIFFIRFNGRFFYVCC